MVTGISYFFAAMITAGCVFILFSKSVMRTLAVFAALMVGVAAIFALNSAEYLAVVQLLIYAGGMVILLAFSLMFTQPNSDHTLTSRTHFVIPGTLLSLILLVGFFSIYWRDSPSPQAQAAESTLFGIGISLFTRYLLIFEIVGFILLVVLVGAAFLSKKSKWQ